MYTTFTPAWLAEYATAVIRRAFDEALGGVPSDLEVELTVVNGAVGPSLVAQASNDGDLLVIGASVRRRWAAAPCIVCLHRSA